MNNKTGLVAKKDGECQTTLIGDSLRTETVRRRVGGRHHDLTALRHSLMMATIIFAAVFAPVANSADPAVTGSVHAKDLEKANEELVFADDFTRDAIGPNWRVVNGNWTIKDLALCATAGDGAIIVCEKPIGNDVRIEYDCVADDPLDLSAFLGVQPGPAWGTMHKQGYFFGFGSYGNTMNKIARAGIEMITETRNLPKARQWYHVVLQKQGHRLKMVVDGKLVMEANDPMPLSNGEHFGLYVWGAGKFDNIKAYRLPPDPVSEEDKEPVPQVNQYKGFENDETGKPPAGVAVEAAGGGSVAVVEFPNWYDTNKGKVTAQDKCVSLCTPDAAGSAAMRLEFTPIPSGFLEMDVMAGEYQGKPLRISLLGEDGAELAALQVDETGTFCADRGDAGLSRFEYAPKMFEWRAMKERVYLRPNRWFTIRIRFDCGKQKWYLGLVNYIVPPGYFATLTPDYMGVWMELGNGIPFMKTGSAVKAVSIRAGAKAKLYVDNTFVYGPVHPFMVNGLDSRFPARKLLNVTYEDRRDPLTLKVYSCRHVLPKVDPGNEEYARILKTAPEFHAAGVRYSEILVRQAFLAEAMQGLDRAAYHLAGQGKLSAADRGAVVESAQRVAATEEALGRLYQAFAAVYLGGMDKAKLSATFPQPAEELARNIDKVEKDVKALTARLAGMAPADAPRLAPAACGAEVKDCAWSREKGFFMKDGAPAYVHGIDAPGWASYSNFDRILDLPGCLRFWRKASTTNSAEFVNRGNARGMQTYFDQNPGNTVYYLLVLAMHDQRTYGPEWWFEKYGVDRDIYIQDKDGKPVGIPAGKMFHAERKGADPMAYLNYWHPAVKDFYRDVGRDIGNLFKTEYPGRARVFVWGGEEGHEAAGNETGHNPSAIAAFREYLRATYKNIADLNNRWGSSYASFDAITAPAPDLTQPTGLAYEFSRFRNAGYANAIKLTKAGLAEGCPDVPVSGYININHGGSDRKGGFDLVPYVDALDIFTYHTYGYNDWQPMNRCMDSLRKAFGNKGLGCLEWGAYNVNNGQFYDEESYKANGMAMLFDSMAWGLTLHDLWRGFYCYESQGENWPEPRLGNAVLRYSSTFMPLSWARIRRLGRPAFEYPTVAPDVAVLEITSNFHNYIPTANWWFFSVRNRMNDITPVLEKKGWNFGYLYEQLLLDGRQSLDGIQTVIVPVGFCCPPELAEQLLTWTRKGGTLVLVGPGGIWNQYGRPDNRLLKAAFGESGWELKPNSRIWSPTNEKIMPVRTNESSVYQAGLDKGQVVLFADLSAGFPFDRLTEVMEKHTRRTVRCDNPDFKWVLRGAPDAYYLYAVNVNTRPLEGPGEGEFTLNLSVTAAADLGIDPYIAVPLATDGTIKRFKLRLAQGEGTLIRLNRENRNSVKPNTGLTKDK